MTTTAVEPRAKLAITVLPLESIEQSRTNPRKHFDDAKLMELTDSIRSKGVTTPILVRPHWCVGWDGDPDNKPIADCANEPYEIIAGARRYRASLLAEQTEIPAIIREESDADALELQWIENLQRVDLDPIEEAEGFQTMLSLKHTDGTPKYTAKLLAERIGKSPDVVYRRLKLLQLPAPVQKDVREGKCPPELAALIARVPGEKARAKAAEAILRPKFSEGPMSMRQARQFLQDEFMVSLGTATFDTKKEYNLSDPNPGPCTTCPHRSGNNPELTDVGRGDMCTSPECFKRKEDAAWEIYRLSQFGHSSGNCTALPRKECERLFQYSCDDELPGCRYILTSAKPSEDLLRKNAENNKTWKSLVKDSGIVTVLIRTPSGKTLETYELELAIEAAKQNGHKIFKDGAGEKPKQQTEEERQAEIKARDAAREEQQRLADRLYNKLMDVATKGMTLAQFRTVVEMIPVGFGDIDAIETRRGFTSSREMASAIQGMNEDKLKCFLIDLALSEMIDWNGDFNPTVEPLCRAFGINWKQEKKEMKAEEIAAAARTPLPGEVTATDATKDEAAADAKSEKTKKAPAKKVAKKPAKKGRKK